MPWSEYLPFIRSLDVVYPSDLVAEFSVSYETAERVLEHFKDQ